MSCTDKAAIRFSLRVKSLSHVRWKNLTNEPTGCVRIFSRKIVRYRLKFLISGKLSSQIGAMAPYGKVPALYVRNLTEIVSYERIYCLFDKKSCRSTRCC